MKLLLDEHYPPAIAARLRAAGHDVVNAREQGLESLDDESLFAHAEADHRALVTNNARDFVPIVRRWAASCEEHAGLILTSDSSMSRRRDAIGAHVEALEALMDANPGRRALANRVHWLSPTPRPR